VNSVITTSKVNEFNLGYTRNSHPLPRSHASKFEIVSNIQSDPYLFWGGPAAFPRTGRRWITLVHPRQPYFKAGANIRWYSSIIPAATNFYPRLTSARPMLRSF